MSRPDPYLLGYRQAEQDRLERQAEELAHESEWLFEQIGVRQGWRVGPRVPRLLHERGIVDVRVNPLIHVYPPGHPRRMLLLDFVENARARLLEKRLISEAELAELTAALRRHLEDPATLAVSSLFLQVWGRVPEP
jgi:hypothetical protein